MKQRQINAYNKHKCSGERIAHINNMMGMNPTQLQKPLPPRLPPPLKLRNELSTVPRLILIAIFIDYMQLFDANSKKTGSGKWFKSLTQKQVNKIEISLRKWTKQTFQQPQSPKFKSVLQSLSRNSVLSRISSELQMNICRMMVTVRLAKL